MSLHEPKFRNIVLKQVWSKLHVNNTFWQSLFFMQWFGILISAANTSSMSGGHGPFYLSHMQYSSTMLMSMTFLWIIVSAINLGLQVSRRVDYSFVTTRTSQFLANVLVLVILSAIGALTAYLGNGVIQLFNKLIRDGLLVQKPFTILQHLENVTGIFGYMLLFAAFAYLGVSLFQWNRYVVVGLFILYGFDIALFVNGGVDEFISQLPFLFTGETFLVLFLLKVFLTISLLFSAAWAVSRHKEVAS